MTGAVEMQRVKTDTSEFFLTGREVSCFTLQYVFWELERRGESLDPVVRGLPYPLDHLRDPSERVDWDTFQVVARRIEMLWGIDEIFELGARAHEAPMVRWMAFVARTLFSPVEYYRWALREFSRKFACVESSLHEVEPGFFRCYLFMREGYERNDLLFRALQGGFSTMPTLLGLPRGDVSWEALPNGAVYEVRVTKRGGSLAWLRRLLTRPFGLRWAAKELRDAHGQLHERYCELIRKDAALRESECDLRALMEQASDAIVISDSNLSIVDVNMRACEWFGRPRTELLSLSASDLLDSTELGGTSDLLIGTEPSEPRETTIKRSDGRALDVEISSTLLDDGRLLWIVRDISSRKRIEEDRKRHQQELELRLETQAADLRRAHAASRELERRVAHAEQLRAAEDLAASLAHAINNPLAALIGRLELAKEVEEATERAESDATEDGELSSSADTALRLARRVHRIVAETLQLFQKGSLEVGHQSLHELLSDVCEELGKRAELRGVELRVELPDTLPKIEANRALLTTALVAIAENGIDAMETGGCLSIRATPLSMLPVVEIEICDQGPGIPASIRERVFEPFFTTKGGGTGLGLAIARDIIYGHGGRIQLEVEPGRGTRARIELRVEGGRLEANSRLELGRLEPVSGGSVAAEATALGYRR